MDNATLKSLAKKYRDAIADYSDERSNGDGWWIYLKEPFFNDQMECRTIHEQKLGDCIKELKRIVDNNIITPLACCCETKSIIDEGKTIGTSNCCPVHNINPHKCHSS